jgi:hypothetical protein
MSTHPFSPPQAYREEVALLRQEGIGSWEAVASLASPQIRGLARHSPGSEARLIRLRGQARLVVGVDLAPAEAALLLHAGVADPRALAMAEADDLQRQVGRLQRRLTGTAMAPISLATVRAWILRARAAASRPGN